MSARPSRKRRSALLILQVALGLAILLPFFWMVSVSLKPGAEPFAIPARLWPENPPSTITSRPSVPSSASTS